MKLATEEQILDWKEKHGDVFVLKSKEEKKVAYLRAPSRQEISYASQAGTKDPMMFNEQILKQCWLHGDEEIITNTKLFMGISSHLDQLLKFAEFELEKL